MTMLHLQPVPMTPLSRYRHKSGPPLIHPNRTASDLMRTQSLQMLHTNHTEFAQPSLERQRSKSESSEDVQLDPNVCASWCPRFVGATSAERRGMQLEQDLETEKLSPKITSSEKQVFPKPKTVSFEDDKSLCSDSLAVDGHVESEIDGGGEDDDENENDGGEDEGSGEDCISDNNESRNKDNDNDATTTAVDGDDCKEEKLSSNTTTDPFESPQLSLHSDPPTSDTFITVVVENDDDEEENYTPFGSHESNMPLEPDTAKSSDNFTDEGPPSSSSEPHALPYIDTSTEPTELGNTAVPNSDSISNTDSNTGLPRQESVSDDGDAPDSSLPPSSDNQDRISSKAPVQCEGDASNTPGESTGKIISFEMSFILFAEDKVS